MPITSRTSPDQQSAPPLFTALRWLGRLVLLLMVAAIVYATWMMAVNWSAIGV